MTAFTVPSPSLLPGSPVSPAKHYTTLLNSTVAPGIIYIGKTQTQILLFQIEQAFELSFPHRQER